jgi:hypothetical protein
MLGLLLGCGDAGPTLYPVTGTVSHQGEALPLGTVMFVPDHGPPSGPAPIAEDGSYRLEAVAGEHAVQVVAVPPREGRADPSVEGGFVYTDDGPPEPLVPRKYNNYQTSGVTVTVKPEGSNQIDINLP